MAKNKLGVMEVVKKNAWAIALLIVGWIVGFALLQQQVTALEEKVSQYPSQDWFQLKFENIDERFDSLEEERVDRSL